MLASRKSMYAAAVASRIERSGWAKDDGGQGGDAAVTTTRVPGRRGADDQDAKEKKGIGESARVGRGVLVGEHVRLETSRKNSWLPRPFEVRARHAAKFA